MFTLTVRPASTRSAWMRGDPYVRFGRFECGPDRWSSADLPRCWVNVALHPQPRVLGAQPLQLCRIAGRKPIGAFAFDAVLGDQLPSVSA